VAISSSNALNEIAAGLAAGADRVIVDKASIASQVSGGFSSLWRATGVPTQAAVPTAFAVCTKALVGAIGFTNQTSPVTSYLAWAYATCANAAQAVEIHDRLGHMGGLSGTVTTAQTVNVDASNVGITADRRGDSNYSDLQWFLEWYTATGATGVNATCAVTYDDNSTGNIVVAVPTNTAASRMVQIIPAVAGKFIKSIQSVTLSATTGSAGNFGITVTRQRTILRTDLSNKGQEFTWAQLGLPEIPNDSCLFIVQVCVTSSTGSVRAGGKIIHV